MQTIKSTCVGNSSVSSCKLAYEFVGTNQLKLMLSDVDGEGSGDLEDILLDITPDATYKKAVYINIGIDENGSYSTVETEEIFDGSFPVFHPEFCLKNQLTIFRAYIPPQASSEELVLNIISIG